MNQKQQTSSVWSVQSTQYVWTPNTDERWGAVISVNTLEHMQRQKQANACEKVTSYKTGWVVAGVGAGRTETNTYFP